jgi:hypothetical protein
VIELADDALAGWAGGVLPGASVSLDRATDADVVLDLVELGDLGRPPLQVALRYRVSTGGADVRERHRRLGELLFAALAAPEYEVELTPDASAPRPSFVMSVPLRPPVPAAAPPPVRAPLVLGDAPVRILAGVVLGPEDVPIADAFVELPLLGLATRSDHRGRFTFAAVPSRPAQLVVHAKARTFPFSVDSPDVELRLDLLPKG